MYDNKQAYEHTRYFAEECGMRIAGKEAVIKASDYIVKKFESYGVDVELHEFKLPLYHIKNSQVRAKVDGKWMELKHTHAIFSKETPKEGITYPLVYIEGGSVANIKAKDVKGKAVLICRDSYVEYPDLNMYKRLYEYGVKAVFYTSSDGHKAIPFVYANYSYMDEPYTIPTAILSYEDAKELAKREDVEIFYTCQFDIEETTTRNTIGIIEGTNPELGNILVCAHLDSAESSVGASDDAGGVGCVMEMARHYGELKKKGILPKRTIRFIAWSGHECGLYGSRNFILDYPEVVDNMKFVFNYDILGNALSSPLIWAGCNEEVEKEITKVVKDLSLDWNVDIGPWIVDTISFGFKQIPHLTLTSGFYAINHTPFDNMDYISQEAFVTPLRFSEAMLEWLANADHISQGYPAALYEDIKSYGKMYGWGFFED